MANMIISKYQSISINKSSLELAAMKGMSSTVELIVSITYKLNCIYINFPLILSLPAPRQPCRNGINP